MLDQYANLASTSATWEQPEGTLCEATIPRERKSRVALFAQSKLGKRLQRVNWNGIVYWLAVVCGVFLGALLNASATLAGFFELHGGCQ